MAALGLPALPELPVTVREQPDARLNGAILALSVVSSRSVMVNCRRGSSWRRLALTEAIATSNSADLDTPKLKFANAWFPLCVSYGIRRCVPDLHSPTRMRFRWSPKSIGPCRSWAGRDDLLIPGSNNPYRSTQWSRCQTQPNHAQVANTSDTSVLHNQPIGPGRS